MSYSTDPSARASFIGDLRALADFLDRHDGGRDQVNHVACLLGATIIDEIASGGHYRAERVFGQITYGVVSIPEAHMAAYHALNSYDGCVSPDTP